MKYFKSPIEYLFIILFFLYQNCERQESKNYQALVSANYNGEAGEFVDGTPTFNTIEQALNAIPKNNINPFIVYIRNGEYYEKLTIDKSNVYFLGESRDGTIISYDATGDTPNPVGGTYGTWGCATIIVNTPDFHVENLTIKNGFDYPANSSKPDDDPKKVENPQAVALMTSASSDRAVFINCKISGYQDTVFANAGRHYFDKCRIDGHVDFIFGAGQAVFDSCEIVSKNRKNKNPTGYITAPSTPITYPYGFLFTNCKFIKENPEVSIGSVRLGRPWHPGANPQISGSAVFINCFMDDHIGSKGYARISSRDSTGNRIWFDLESDSRFFEYGSYGPGAIKSSSRPTFDDKEAQWYTISHVLNGWNL